MRLKLESAGLGRSSRGLAGRAAGEVTLEFRIR